MKRNERQSNWSANKITDQLKKFIEKYKTV